MILLDTTVLAYAVGGEHPLRAPSQRVIEAAAARPTRVTTTVEVIQEFAHVRARQHPRSNAVALARSFMELLGPLVGTTAEDLDFGLRLYERNESLGSFDAVLAALAIGRGVEAFVSSDAGFASVPRLPFVGLGSPELDEVLA